MFGFITPNLQTLDDDQKSRYQSVYCGLCHSLRDNYSNISRLALSYDLTFLVLLLSSLYEPAENHEPCNCIFHPGSKYTTAQNKFSDYCADITVALAYHKILDDINDENKVKAKVGKLALQKSYEKAKSKIPNICSCIENSLSRIGELENAHKEQKNSLNEHEAQSLADEIAKTFGLITAKIFASYDDVFKPTLENLGANLGRFIYFMDAAVDIEKDIKTGNFNPFLKKGSYPDYTSGPGVCEKGVVPHDTHDTKFVDGIKKDLTVFAGMTTSQLEKLPLIKDIEIIENILFEGIWLRFNQHYK